MKKINILVWALIIASSLSIVSCSDFLDQNCQTALTEEEIYSNANYIELNLSGIYTKFRNLKSDFKALVFMMGTDECQQGAYQIKSSASEAALDKYDANLNSSNEYITSLWNARWPIVTASAKIISALEKKNPAAGTKEAQLLGEACFIRGFVDFELAMYWGEIPIIDIDKAYQLGYGRQPIKDVWAFIISDFQKAAEFCPTTNTAGRATSGAGYAMLGKAYMCAPEATGLRDFSKAAKCFESMMDRYSLVDYSKLFDCNTPNTAESIYELQFSPSGCPTYPDINKIQFQIGSRAVQSFWGDGCYYSGYDHLVPTEHAYNNVDKDGIWEEGDLRKDVSIRYDFTYYGQTPDLHNIQWEDLGNDYDELKPHIKKYEDFRTDQHTDFGVNNMWYSAKNIPILRLGDIYLCYAECLNEMDKTTDAVAWVNKVRNRAWGFNIPADKLWNVSMSKSDFRNKIMDERMRELFGESWRRIDLIRTGKLVELSSKYNRWTKNSGTVKSYHQLYPIPDTEIKQNDDISTTDQNPGY